MQQIILVQDNSDIGDLAAEMAHLLRQEQQIHVQGVGPEAVLRLTEAIIGARMVLAAEGRRVTCAPDYGQVADNGEKRHATAVLFTVEAHNNPDRAARAPLRASSISEQVADDFAERQDWVPEDNKLAERLAEHTSESPTLSGGDVDARWDQSGVGEETVGGMAPTPDQDLVDEIGAAMGITYEDDEPLHTGEKLAERDRERWELDPESAAEEGERPS